MDKILFVTGATAGIGKATAKLFVREGWKVIGTGRRRERLEQLRTELGEAFLPLVLDIRDRGETAKVLANLPDAFSRIDVLLNNAGLCLDAGPLPEANLDDWECVVQTNIMGLLYCTRLILPGMVERRRGHIVNLASAAALRPAAGNNVYGSTKAFVRLLSDNMRADLHGTPIRVSCISPGRTFSEFGLVRNHGNEESTETLYSTCEPLQSEDIASAIWWVVNCPPNMDVTQMEILPTGQADAGSKFTHVS